MGIRISDHLFKGWVDSKHIDDIDFFMENSGYKVKSKYGETLGFGISMVIYQHLDTHDRLYEVCVGFNSSVIQFEHACDEWQFLLDYFPKIKQYWNGYLNE